MSQDNLIKLPRLYTGQNLSGSITLDTTQTHYLRTVLRKNTGDALRLFNGRDGEWVGILEGSGKKDGIVRLTDKIADQPARGSETHLVFALIKKQRLDWLIEKSVELGATHLHPVLTQNTDVRHLNPGRLQAQVIEAAEQCGRLDLPVIHDLADMRAVLSQWDPAVKMIACIERAPLPLLNEAVLKQDNLAFLIGPEGGFSAQEKEFIAEQPFAHPVSLGNTVLRCETAAAACLSARLLAHP